MTITPTNIQFAILAQLSIILTHFKECGRSYLTDIPASVDKLDISSNAINIKHVVEDLYATSLKNIKNDALVEFINLNFSTSTEKDALISKMFLLGSVQEYFNYSITECGLTGINIRGTENDWSKLYNGVVNLRTNMEWINDETALKGVINDWWDEMEMFCEISLQTCKIGEMKYRSYDTLMRKKVSAYWKYFICGYYPTSGSGAHPYIEGHIVGFSRFSANPENCLTYSGGNMVSTSSLFNSISSFSISSTTPQRNLLICYGNMKICELEDSSIGVNSDYNISSEVD